MRIVIVGAGGHGQVVADTLKCQAANGEPVEPVGYVDDNVQRHGKTYVGLPVLGALSDLATLEFEALVIGIGSNGVRRNLYERFATLGYTFQSAIHPTAVIAADVTIKSGCMISAGVIINTGSTVAENCIINTGATIDHHNIIFPHTHIAPGVNLGGDVKIGAGSLIGIGATILPQISVGENVTVGGGAVVVRDIPSDQTVVGIPAK